MSRKNSHSRPRYKLLPRDTIQAATQGEPDAVAAVLRYATIQAATQGDPDAIAAVLRHYEGYIAKLSTRCLFDEYGNTYLCVDEALRRRLEIKLISGLLAFKAA